MRDQLDFESFCVRNTASLIRLLTLYCGEREMARDLAQETMARVWVHWPKVQRMERPDLWTRRVALNLANSQFRHRKVERARLHELVGELNQAGPDAGDEMLVRAALLELTKRQRTAVLLRYFEDLSVEQTSDLMGCSEGTVKKLSARALVGLRAVIGSDVEVSTDA